MDRPFFRHTKSPYWKEVIDNIDMSDPSKEITIKGGCTPGKSEMIIEPLYLTETWTLWKLLKFQSFYLNKKHWKYRIYKWWHKTKFKAIKFLIFYLK